MFHYFAYGSNLLKERIQLSNKSAQFVGVGFIEDYTLSFGGFSNNWFGATATIKPSPSEYVLGTVWKLCISDLHTLDLQESAPVLYSPVEIPVTLVSENLSMINCRTYMLNSCEPGDPSPYYLDIILRGAVQSQLPQSYIDRLKKIKHNGYFGGCNLYMNVLNNMPTDERYSYQIFDLKSLQFE
ncbi:Gamma-glutamylcyclotransferase [Schistosoma japonicum]|uniref:gamma-glutamylcyclotransferase n=1 Tax=Schistosoma japonicum TaxID=6182 RepID=A0A4Z2DUD7_SCHJA|nr:Gamma-glutamylcyclotransferase [Schistosoma japonicum]KAH8862692.1 Gamma-glutamylcyclotransferase [Schistosoma japonicum]TNN19988.1 Gamma-glutamylcyclotransferase [Schistosoma japonicum]TNN19989.1 Gamma-glutamylcyclotransferase [Schistosoma japonicum]